MLTIVGGPMFAGKTTWIVEHAAKLSSTEFIVCKPSMDTRYSPEECVTHTGSRLPAFNIDIQNPQLPDLDESISTIMFDELNFFDATTLWPVIEELLQQGKNVIGVGLLYDSEKRPFGATLPLSEKADSFIALTAICDGCAKAAEHSYRKVFVDGQVLLGATEMYGACCSDCHVLLNGHSSLSQAATPDKSTAS